MSKNRKKLIIYLILTVSCLVTARGFMTKSQLAGHDTAAYYITQHQFHENIKQGVLLPRWAPDMRYGYGHPKLQYRPPLLHYLAEPFLYFSENYYFAINMALIILTFVAGFGMFSCCRLYMKYPTALIGAAAYLSANYLLSDMYIRGAYYEVAAYAFMPWIIWAQTAIFQKRYNNTIRRYSVILTIGIGWTALICSHPQIMVFFLPLAVVHFFFMWDETRSNKAAKVISIASFAGFMIAAPYWFVAWQELPFVRMEIFYTGLEAYTQHFITMKGLLFETWPENYVTYSYADFLGRPRHLEIRSLNIWAIAALIITPFFWFLRNSHKSRFNRTSLMFYLCFLGLLILALPISRGIWFLITPIQTFNFPWRVLGVASLCLAILTGLTSEKIFKKINLSSGNIYKTCIVISLLIIISTWDKSSGWSPPPSQKLSTEDFQKMNLYPGIPKQFYTPKWVKFYANGPSQKPIRFLSGKGTFKLKNKKTTLWTFNINAETDVEIALAHYYYPGWDLIKIEDEKIPITPLNGTGEISFKLSPGNHELKLQLKNTFARNLGNILSIIGIALLFISFYRLKRHSQKEKK